MAGPLTALLVTLAICVIDVYHVYMYMCMYVCMYVLSKPHTHIHIHTRTYRYADKADQARGTLDIHIHMHTYTHTYIHIRIHTYRYADKADQARGTLDIHKKTHTYIYTYIHIRIHTYRYADKADQARGTLDGERQQLEAQRAAAQAQRQNLRDRLAGLGHDVAKAMAAAQYYKAVDDMAAAEERETSQGAQTARKKARMRCVRVFCIYVVILLFCESVYVLSISFLRCMCSEARGRRPLGRRPE